MPEQPWSFYDVWQAHKFAAQQDPEYGRMPIGEFSRRMNAATGTDMFKAGDVSRFGGYAKMASRAFDELLQPVSRATGAALGSFGGLVGPKTEETFRGVGEALPRTAAEVGAFGLALSNPWTMPLAALPIASAGAKTYEETGSPWAGLASSAGFGIIPGAGHLGRAAASRLAAPVAESLERAGAKGLAGLTEKIGEKVGGVAGAVTGAEATGELASGFAAAHEGLPFTAGLYNPIEPQRLGATLAAFLPWEIANLPAMRGYNIAGGKARPMGWGGLLRGEEPQFRSLAAVTRYRTMMNNVFRAQETTSRRDPSALSESLTQEQLETPQLSTAPVPAPQPQNVPGPSPAPTLVEKQQNVATQVANVTNTPEVSKLVGAPDVMDLSKWLPYAEGQKMDASALRDTLLARFGKDEVMKAIPDAADKGLYLALQAQMRKAKKRPYAAHMFFADQLSGGLFGSVAVEQLNADRPFGYKPDAAGNLPTDAVRSGMKKLLTSDELGMFDDVGLQDFLKTKGPKVNKSELQGWLMKNQPEVEVRYLGKNEPVPEDPLAKESYQLMHQLETWGYEPDYDMSGVRGQVGLTLTDRRGEGSILNNNDEIRANLNKFPEAHRASIERFLKVQEELAARGPMGWRELEPGFDVDTYRTITPHHGDQEVLLMRLSTKPEPQRRHYEGEEETQAYRDERQRMGVRYEGPHFGSEDKNVLAFVRGYWTEKSGKKIFVAFEVQSDWEANVRYLKEKFHLEQRPEGWLVKDDQGRSVYSLSKTREEAQAKLDAGVEKTRPGHPLLRDPNRLALKAAINHAIKNGADAIAISDAETAMLTEGHDRAALYVIKPGEYRINNLNAGMPQLAFLTGDVRILPDNTFEVKRASGGWMHGERLDYEDKIDIWHRIRDQLPGEWKVTQEKGMRLNYDDILPRIGKELTGVEGERVSLGIHRNAITPEALGILSTSTDPNATLGPKGARKDLIFKNPDDTPKTDITARMFSLDKAKAELLRRGGYTFFGKDKIMQFAYKMESEGYSKNEIASAVIKLQALKPRVGEDLADYVARVVGVDKALMAANDPDTVMDSAYKYMSWYFAVKEGENPVRTAYLTDKALAIVARFMPYVGRTKFFHIRGGDPTTLGPAYGRLNSVIGLVDLSEFKGLDQPIRTFMEFASMGHELTHDMILNIAEPTPEVTPEAARRTEAALQSASKLSHEERIQTMRSMGHQLLPKKYHDQFDTIYGDQFKRYGDGEIGEQEFLADFTSMLVISTGTKKGTELVKDVAFFSDEDTHGFIHSVYKDLSTIFDAVITFGKQLLKGIFKVHDATAYERTLRDVYDNMTAVLKSVSEAERVRDGYIAMLQNRETMTFDSPITITGDQVERLINIHNLASLYGDPTGYMVKASAHAMKMTVDESLRNAERLTKPVARSAKLAPNEPYGEYIRKWERLIPIGQFVRSHPIFKPFFDLAINYVGMASDGVLRVWQGMRTPGAEGLSGFTDDNGRVDIKRLNTVLSPGPLNDAIRAIGMRQRDDKKVLTSQERTSMFPEYSRLSMADRAIVDKSMQQFSEMFQKCAIIRVKAARDKIESGITTIIQSNARKGAMQNVPLEEMKKTARLAVAVVFDKDDANSFGVPNEAGGMQYSEAEYLKAVAELQQRIPNPIVLDTALAAAGEQLKGFDALRTTLLGERDATGAFEGVPYYWPEVRYRDWHIAWREKNGETQLWDFDTKEEAGKKYAELKLLQSQGKLDFLKAYNKQTRQEGYKGMVREEMFKAYADTAERLFTSVMNHLDKTDPEQRDLIEEVKAAYDPHNAIAYMTTSPYMMEREGIGGRERLNPIEGAMHYINATATSVAKAFGKQEEVLLLSTPEMRANPAIAVEARKYLSYVFDPQGKEFTILKNMIFFNFMGFNPSNLIIELSQQFLTMVPMLIREGAGIGQAYKYMMGAMRDVGRAAVVAHKLGVGLANSSKQVFADVETDEVVKKAVTNRHADLSIMQDLYNEQDLEYINARNMSGGTGKILSKAQLIGNAAYGTVQLARKFYAMAPRFNSLCTFIAGYRFAKDVKGMDRERAYEFAKDLNYTTMFGGGRVSRPLALTGLGKATGIGGVVYILNGYTANMYAFLGRLLRESIGLGNNLSEAEKVSARKGFGIAMGTQALLAGVMGLPLTAATIAVVEQFFPEAEIKKNLRSLFVKLAGDDEAMGHYLADGAMSGALNLTPADFGSRFQLGGLLGVSPYDGFSWQNLVGPAGQMLQNYAQAGSLALGQGKPLQALAKVAPGSALKNLVKLGVDYNQTGQLAIRDAQSNLVMEPTNLDLALMSLGFRPKKLSQYYEQQSIALRSEEIAKREMQDFHRDLAKQLLQGKTAEVRTALLERQAEGGYDVRAGLRRVIELAQQMQAPRDLSRTGSTGNLRNRADIAQMYPHQGQPSEVQQLMQRFQIAARFGYPFAERMSRSDMMTARMVDTYLAAHPTATRTQALLAVQQLRHPASFAKRYGGWTPD